MDNQKLDFGCGNSKKAGFIGIDNNPNAKNADIICDLNKFPYPFEESSIIEIFASHIAEHLNDLEGFFAEIYRIAKPNAKLILKVPHYSYGFVHPLHKHGFSVLTFIYFNKSSKESYGQETFEVKNVKLYWRRPGYQHGPLIKLLDRLINRIANIKPFICERYWCYLVGGFEEIEFVVEIKK